MRCLPLGRLLLACLPPLLLAACGGGGDAGDGGAAPPPVPSTVGDVPGHALTDARAYTRYVAEQTAGTGPQPLNLGDLTPPVSDTDAPIAVP